MMRIFVFLGTLRCHLQNSATVTERPLQRFQDYTENERGLTIPASQSSLKMILFAVIRLQT